MKHQISQEPINFETFKSIASYAIKSSKTPMELRQNLIEFVLPELAKDLVPIKCVVKNPKGKEFVASVNPASLEVDHRTVEEFDPTFEVTLVTDLEMFCELAEQTDFVFDDENLEAYEFVRIALPKDIKKLPSAH